MIPPNYEADRKRWKPETVRVLFIGISRPPNGSFFYHGNTALYDHTRYAFAELLGQDFDAAPLGFDTFLSAFRAAGCYLDEICLEPIAKLSKLEREATLASGTQDFAQRLARYKPEACVTVMKSVEPYAQKAMQSAGFAGAFTSLPFPSRGRQKAYEQQLGEFLRPIL